MLNICKTDELFKAWQNGLCPGGQVYVRHNGKLIYNKCFGYADIERPAPVTRDTVFHVASVSKQITSMCVLLLDEDGKLNIDDDVRKYIPELINFEESVSLRDMMNNVSGIRDQWDLQIYSGTLMVDEISQEHLNYINSLQKSLNFAPRSQYLYSNANFSMLAEIAAKVSGMSFNDFATERIFKPLDMQDTLFRESTRQIIQNRALSYSQHETDGEISYKLAPVNYSNYGATSLHTTASDFLKWTTTFTNPVICNAATLEKLLTSPTLTTGEKITYACGIDVSEYKGFKILQHSGGDGGYRSHAACLPDEKLDIIIFSNVPNINIYGATQEIIKMLLNIPDEPAVQDEAKPDEPGKPEPVPFTDDELKAYPGAYYSSEVETFYRVYEKDGKLYIRHRRHNDEEIIKTSDDKLTAHHREIKFTQSDGIAAELCWYGGRVLELKFKRIDLSGY